MHEIISMFLIVYLKGQKFTKFNPSKSRLFFKMIVSHFTPLSIKVNMINSPYSYFGAILYHSEGVFYKVPKHFG